MYDLKAPTVKGGTGRREGIGFAAVRRFWTLLTAGIVTATLSTMATQMSTAYKSLQELDPAGELTDAFKQASACKSLTSTTG